MKAKNMRQTDNFCVFDTKKEIKALVTQPPGAFLLQQVSKNDFILSVCAMDANDSKTNEILHFLVVKTSNGYKFKVGPLFLQHIKVTELF